MKRNYLHYYLTLATLILCLANCLNISASYRATVNIASSPAEGGLVFVGNDDNCSAASCKDITSANSQKNVGFSTSGDFTFYFCNSPKPGYTFKGWSTDQNANTGDGVNNNPYSITLKGTTFSNTLGTGGATYNYYAIFARLAVDNKNATSQSYDFGEVKRSVKPRPTHTFAINHAHAGKVTASLSNTTHFAIDKTSVVANSTTEGTEYIVVTYNNPPCDDDGEHSTVLTIASNNGLKAIEITITATSVKESQELSWVEPINTNILKGTTAKIEATATSRLGVTYTSDNTNVLTVDTDGNITAVGKGEATITASQAGDCTYAAANSITKNFTVSDKKTPTFWLENNPDLTEKNLMVDGTTTINITNIDAEGFNAVYDTNLLGFSLVDGVATITAKNAGTATLTLTQTETDAVFGVSRTFTFNISKHTGALTLTNNLGTAYKVDDAANVVDCYTASNSEVEVQVASSNTDVIAVVEGQLKAVGVGTATVTFSQEETYKWTELTASQEITVTKYDLSASISQSAATWDATINNPFAISYDLNDYTVEALNPAIATYTDGAIQTYAETGTAHFVISRAEDYKYNQLADTLSISVAPKTESDIIYQDNTQYDINYGNSHTYTVSNVLPGDILTVDFWETNAATGGLAIYGYENDVETEIMPNTEFSTSAKTYTFTLGKAYTSIKIKGDGGGFSVVNKHCANFTIRRNLHISANSSNVNMESTIRTNATATISLDYGSLGSTFKVVSDNPKITVAPASFDAEGSGTKEITLTGDATALGTETATITIYDQSKKTTINVTSTINRIPQTISWQSSFENLDVFSTVRLDATASGATEVVYSIAEGEQGKASIAGNVLSFNEAGTVHVVATAAQSDIYESVSDTVSVEVRLAQPVVSVLPTVEAVAYGTALIDAMLQGGVAKYGETTVEGSFAWADERITEGLMPNTYSFNVRFTPADATHYSTAVCTVGVTVNKAQQTIAWQSRFENLDVFSTVRLGATASGSTEVVYSIAEGEQEKASIAGNVLSFKEAGTVHVVATAAQSDIYESVSDTVSVVVSLAQPVVSVFPTVEAVTYGTALTNAMLQGGVAKYGETTVEGSFAWADEQITDGLTPNTYSFNVRFTPADAKHYSTADCTVGVTVNKAQQTISWQSSFENLNVQSEVILSATAQNAVRFAVSDTAVATITGDRLRLLKAGTIDVVAIAEGSDLYEEVADTIKGIVIARIDPVVSQWPSATLTYGKTLTDVVLAGEAVEKGVFQWGDTITDGDLVAVQIAGEYTYAAKFVPTEGGLFNTLYGKATITIVEATQTILWENAPTACKVGERIALEAVASSGLAVEYYVDQIDKYAMIDAERNELVALAKGAIQLRVSQAGETGKYAAAEDLVLTIDIEAGNTTATEQVSANEQVMVRKVLRDGVLYILRGGMCYDINGRLIGAE